MKRILNQAELDRLADLEIINKIHLGGDFYIYTHDLFESSINSKMIGKSVEECEKDNYSVLPWMICPNKLDKLIDNSNKYLKDKTRAGIFIPFESLDYLMDKILEAKKEERGFTLYL